MTVVDDDVRPLSDFDIGNGTAAAAAEVQ